MEPVCLIRSAIAPRFDACLHRIAGQYQHPEPHADSQGVVGREGVLHSTKIEPLEGKRNEATEKSTGLDDEQVDAARVQPLGEVREQMS